ncbi:MAG TPA: CotS family spore coat protein [Bacillales bacterium]|nr:CotS family spore coat protein [Bacillales bacterium]
MTKRYPKLKTVGPFHIYGEVKSIDLSKANEEVLNRYSQETAGTNATLNGDEGKSDEQPELTPEMREQLEVLGNEIIKQWSLPVERIELIQGGQMALVWKVMTNEGPFCLKRINRPEKKALFSIHAQHFLAGKGANVPRIIKTKDDELYAKHGPFLFVVYEWIEGRPFDLNVNEEMEWMMKGLAHYHLDSEGYHPPEGVPAASKLGQWPRHYMKRIQQMKAWKLIAEQQPDDPFSIKYMETADDAVASGRSVLSQLQNSHYHDWVAEKRKAPTLCHQDYGTGNTLLRNGEVWVIDLDTTAYDLPVRDLRKLIIPMMTDDGGWRDDLFDLMLNAYESVHPLTDEQKRVMYIDMMFPYELYDVIRDKYSLKNDAALTELEEAFAFEALKEEKLKRKLTELS